MVPLCSRRCGFQEGARRGYGLMGSLADAIRVQGRPISGVQSCGEGALDEPDEMIVECSTSSQAKSEPRKGEEGSARWCDCG